MQLHPVSELKSRSFTVVQTLTLRCRNGEPIPLRVPCFCLISNMRKGERLLKMVLNKVLTEGLVQVDLDEQEPVKFIKAVFL